MAFATLFVAALFLVGCGSDGDSGMMGPAGPPGEPPSDEEIAEIVEDVLEEDPPAADTSELEDAIAALETQVADLMAEDPTIPEILGGMKDTASAADLTEAADKARPTVSGMAFLEDEGIGVDLTSASDGATFSLGNGLTVDGVTLQSFTVKETNKVETAMVVIGADNAVTDRGVTAGVPDAIVAGTAPGTRTTTRGPDGYMRVVVTNDLLADDPMTMDVDERVVSTVTSMFSKDDNGNYMRTQTSMPASDLDGDGDGGVVDSIVTRADGRTVVTTTDSTVTPPVTTTEGPAGPAMVGAVPSALAEAKADFAASDGTIAQDIAMGYGAWLEESFFVVLTLHSEDDDLRGDPDSSQNKMYVGARGGAMPVTSLSGRGESAMWKGLMLGRDMAEGAGAALVKGNASVTARISDAVLADTKGGDPTADVVDVSLTNIVKAADATLLERVSDGIHWTNLDLDGGSFSKGSEISGDFYDGGDEVVGMFSKDMIDGVFGAVEYDMMYDMADSQ